MAGWSLCLVALAALLTDATADHDSQNRRCGFRDLQILSSNDELLPPENITAQSSLIGAYVAASFSHHGPNQTSVWCATVNAITLSQPSVHVAFSQPVLIVALSSGGYTFPITLSFATGSPVPVFTPVTGHTVYVSNFTLEYSETTEGENFTEYTSQDQPTFLVTEETINRFTLLHEPFIATRLRFSIHNFVSPVTGTNAAICWNMALYGCLPSEAFTIAPATVATTTDTPSEVLSTSEPPQQVQLIGISQQKLLSIVIPVAFVTILVVLIIVILGVIVCVKFRGQNSSGRHFQRQRSTIKILDNTVLYQSADPRLQSLDGATIRRVDNVLYDKNQAPGRSDVRNSASYDVVRRRGSMDDNAAYGNVEHPVTEQLSLSDTTVLMSPNKSYAPSQPNSKSNLGEGAAPSRAEELSNSLGPGYARVGALVSSDTNSVPSPPPQTIYENMPN